MAINASEMNSLLVPQAVPQAPRQLEVSSPPQAGLVAAAAPVAAEVRFYQTLPISAVLAPAQPAALVHARADEPASQESKEKKQAEEVRPEPLNENNIKTIDNFPKFVPASRKKMDGRWMYTKKENIHRHRDYFQYLREQGINDPQEYYRQIPNNINKPAAFAFHQNYLKKQNQKSCTALLFSTLTAAPHSLYSGVSSLFKTCRMAR